MYDTPKRWTIFALVYWDDTQLLISFSALDFSQNITHLKNTNISNWMSSNFLCIVVETDNYQLKYCTVHQFGTAAIKFRLKVNVINLINLHWLHTTSPTPH